MNEIYWRLGAFLIGLILFSLWESVMPRRERHISRLVRWPRNLGINFAAAFLVNMVNSVMVRFLVPISAGWAALWASSHGVGLMNWLEMPYVLALVFSIVALDLLIYGQHVLFHWQPWLWRLHMIHHVDQELDASSGIRFHPVEILISLVIKSVAVVFLGAPFLAVVIFEIVLNLSAMFNHGNIRLPQGMDRVLRWVIVTPDMHRVHHSVTPKETHSNFGFNLSLWDKVFGTYRAQPEAGHEKMLLGLPGYEDIKKTGLGWMLVKPFRGRVERRSNNPP